MGGSRVGIGERVKTEEAVLGVPAKDDGGFYDIHLTDEEILALRIYTIITVSLTFKTVLGSESMVFLNPTKVKV